MALPQPAVPNMREALDRRFPHLRVQERMPYPEGAVALGRADGETVAAGRRAFFEHAHVIGTTGGGKTNFLEHVVRQKIAHGGGVCVIDPHGSHPASLYHSLMSFVFERGLHKRRRVHLIDPNADSHITGFNPLALPDPATSVSVIADLVLEAFERVWGDEKTHGKPTIRRILKGAFAALAELRLTLAEADLLFDPPDTRGLRAFALAKLTDRYAKAVLSDLDRIAQMDRTGARFRDEVIGPVNRLAEFTSAPAIRLLLGQRDRALDLRACLDGGDIILCNLSGGEKVSDADAELLGRLLTRFLFFHIKRRKTLRPFWFVIDECQKFLSGDIPSFLAESRKFACGVLLSHQWQSQLGSPDDQTLAAVHNATNVKVAFRIKHPKEAREIAEAVIPLDLEQPVRALIKPTVVGHRRTYFDNWSVAESESWSTSVAESHSETTTESHGETSSFVSAEGAGWSEAQTSAANVAQSYDGFGPVALPQTPVATVIGQSAVAASGLSGSAMRGQSGSTSTGSSVSVSSGTSSSETYSRGRSHSRGASEGLEPVYENLPSAVHSKDNALYFAAQTLRSLTAGEAYVSFVDAEGLKSGKLRVPLVRPLPLSERTLRAIRTLLFNRSPFAVETATAQAALEVREEQLTALAGALREGVDEPDEPRAFRVPAPKRRPGANAADKMVR